MRKKYRTLHIGSTTLKLDRDKANSLESKGLLYRCGPGHGHDLHLTPDHDFTLADIEEILQAIIIEETVHG